MFRFIIFLFLLVSGDGWLRFDCGTPCTFLLTFVYTGKVFVIDVIGVSERINK